jgi:hypothetical protein
VSLLALIGYRTLAQLSAEDEMEFWKSYKTVKFQSQDDIQKAIKLCGQNDVLLLLGLVVGATDSECNDSSDAEPDVIDIADPTISRPKK